MKIVSGIPIAFLLACAQVPYAAHAQQAGTEAAPGEVVVRAYVPRCKARPDDPQDQVDLTSAATEAKQQVIRLDAATGSYGLFPDDYPVTGPDVWQRDGTRLDQFTFRVPDDGSPLCIGAKSRFAQGFAQLRRSFQAKTYWGKVLRFTAFVATRRAVDVRFWLAAGEGSYSEGRKVKAGRNIVAGGDALRTPIQGNHAWMPISYIMEPVPCSAGEISYGVTLDGGGDVWIYKPELTVIPDNELPSFPRHGKEMLEADPVCRHSRYGIEMMTARDGKAAPLRDDRQLTADPPEP